VAESGDQNGELRVPAAGEVRSVLVLANWENSQARKLFAELNAWLLERVDDVRSEGDVRAFCDTQEARLSRGLEIDTPDLVIVLGGDGAMLAAVRAFRDHPAPTLGINFGRVGFLAACPAGPWQEVVAGVLEGGGVLEPRMRLAATLESSGKSVTAVALNEVVVSRGTHQGMLTCSLEVGEDLVTNYRADGLILATPSGSTAYSLAAGGPILAPSMAGVVVTPICPQGLANRPIVLHPGSDITVTVADASGITTLVVDGQAYYRMEQGDVVHVVRHPVPYPLLSMPGLDPYRRLRSRLGWRGSVESTEQRVVPNTRRPARGADAGEAADSCF
jgi:NAD+ kinase